jgi:DNA gyrase/topoisomerase IV subunit B
MKWVTVCHVPFDETSSEITSTMNKLRLQRHSSGEAYPLRRRKEGATWVIERLERDPSQDSQTKTKLAAKALKKSKAA